MADRNRVPPAGRGKVGGTESSIILHVDMDSFFCSVERALDPRLRGKPLIVGGFPEGRGVVVACTYEVRKKGVHAGMPAGRARSLCPEALFLPSRPKVYTQISSGILEILSRTTDRVEPTSVDEAFLDVSGLAGGFSAAVPVAQRVRRRIRERYGLPASVGIGPTKAIAKLASRRAKPDGIEVIPGERVREALDSLPVTAMGGIGEKTAASLGALGIRTLGELARADELVVRRFFGKNGLLLLRLARGEDVSPVLSWDAVPDPKSMSNERTFPRNIQDRESIESAVLHLTEKLARRLRKEGFRGNTLVIKVRFPDFRTRIRSRVLPRFTDDEKTLYSLAREGVFRYAEGKPLRLIGIGLANLVRTIEREEELELDHSRSHYRDSLPVFDAIRDRYGERMIRKARLL